MEYIRVVAHRVKMHLFIATVRDTSQICGCASDQQMAHAKLLPRGLNDDDTDDKNDDCDDCDDDSWER